MFTHLQNWSSIRSTRHAKRIPFFLLLFWSSTWEKYIEAMIARFARFSMLSQNMLARSIATLYFTTFQCSNASQQLDSISSESPPRIRKRCSHTSETIWCKTVLAHSTDSRAPYIGETRREACYFLQNRSFVIEPFFCIECCAHFVRCIPLRRYATSLILELPN